MTRLLRISATCLSLLLAGCSAAGIDTATPAPAAAGAPIVDSVPAGGRVISDINIELCQATPADKPHTVDEALRALRISAEQKGATGVANVTSGLVTTPTPKCNSMAQAMGIAFVQG
ncbi:MAG: hypothetical protein BGO82_00010 [Devosia sp. 67-54]|uniref:hypothetical protein n=1 Tax=unclassified Devosia TaxID=196773 RepID=UPI0009612FF8|nr:MULTISPECIES: hypothetical protein [unclassified Devosia]MBN9306154.1 hypothetical protein [Devosia sp.]OJX16183.1 MAG: hypothetical protein BGO82_00010 [Devosia sp. 67-54]